MKKHLMNVMLCMTLLVGGCGGGDEVVNTNDTATDTTAGSEGTDTTATADAVETPVETPPPPAPARVRVIHASPDAAAAAVAIYVDGSATPAIPSLAYKAATAYADMPGGAHQVAVRPAAAAAAPPPAMRRAS